MRLTPPSFLKSLPARWAQTTETQPRRPSDSIEQAPLATVVERLQALRHVGIDAPVKKGRPNVGRIRATLADQLLHTLSTAGSDGIDAGTLETARRIAAVDPSEASAYGVYTSLCAWAHRAALESARVALKPDVVMHLSCVPRVDRARASWRSFDSVPDTDGLSHVIVVGSAQSHRFHFDPTEGVLTVPAPDTYEHLPSKVIAAMLFFALTGVVKTVLKVDDDHRLRDATRLRTALSLCRSASAVQLGDLRRAAFPGDHTRVWHFGKCADPAVDQRPFGLLNPPRWNNGASGYLLNDASLNLLTWCATHFADYIHIGLYEDMVVSDLLDRHGAKLQPFPMNDVLATVNDY